MARRHNKRRLYKIDVHDGDGNVLAQVFGMPLIVRFSSPEVIKGYCWDSNCVQAFLSVIGRAMRR